MTLKAHISNYLLPAEHGDTLMPGYWVDKRNGDIWSSKQSCYKKLNGTLKDGYRRSKFAIGGKELNFYFHRIVASTLLPLPKPDNISKKAWANTPQEVIDYMKQKLLLVNHIDHNRSNYHPSNLEWTDFDGNAIAYQNHKKSTELLNG